MEKAQDDFNHKQQQVQFKASLQFYINVGFER